MGKTEVDEKDWGTIENPAYPKVFETVKLYTLTNENGVVVQVTSYGATITSIRIPDRTGLMADVVLGFDTVKGYIENDSPKFGCCVGRVANRIGNAEFTLNGVKHQLTKNIDGKHHLHGGSHGFNKFNWQSFIDDEKVVMKLENPDGLEGYPGTVTVTCTFILNKRNELVLDYLANTTKETPINLTNHSYFNLAGHQTGHLQIYKHMIQINASKITETDEESIATGKLINVANTPYDFHTEKDLGAALVRIPEPGFDVNYCLDGAPGKMFSACKFRHPSSGRAVEVITNQPGMQFYTGNYLPDKKNLIYPGQKKKLAKPLTASDGIIGKERAVYEKFGGICFETQGYPNAVNIPSFPSMYVKPDATYEHKVTYKFTVE